MLSARSIEFGSNIKVPCIRHGFGAAALAALSRWSDSCTGRLWSCASSPGLSAGPCRTPGQTPAAAGPPGHSGPKPWNGRRQSRACATGRRRPIRLQPPGRKRRAAGRRCPESRPPAARPPLSSLQQSLESLQTPQSRYGASEAASHGICADEHTDFNTARVDRGTEPLIPGIDVCGNLPYSQFDPYKRLGDQGRETRHRSCPWGAIRMDSSLRQRDATPLLGRIGGI